MYSQTKQLNQEILNHFREEYKKKSNDYKALRNALSANDLNSITINRDIVGKADYNFKYKVKVTGITDQKSSGRCWMFTGLNTLRPYVINSKSLNNFEFSTNYLYFYDLLEKSNLFLETCIETALLPEDDKMYDWLFKNPIGDGGVWNSFANLVEKYGVVPKSVMPETYHSENTAKLNKVLSSILRQYGMNLRNMKRLKLASQRIDNEKIRMMSEIYRILVLFLGEPPINFEYRFADKNGNLEDYKTYTPQMFFKELFPDYKSDDYVMLMNDPSREYYKMYEISYDRNVLEGKNWKYLNLPAEELKIFAIASIKNDEALYASCDVGKQLNKNDGTLDLNNYDYESLLGIKFTMNKAERIKTFESGSTHAMLLMALDTDKDDKPVKWMFENSWGSSYGYNGYLIFTDEWFDEYMFRVVINKKYLDAKTLELLNQKPIVLPPWDPMFSSDN